MYKILYPLLLCLLLTGCDGEDNNRNDRQRQELVEARQCQARAEAQQRQALAEARQREEEAERQKLRERERREYWQGLACTSAVAAVILLVAGTALGSKVRSDHARQHRG